jgi:hypothetical protein
MTIPFYMCVKSRIVERSSVESREGEGICHPERSEGSIHEENFCTVNGSFDLDASGIGKKWRYPKTSKQ